MSLKDEKCVVVYSGGQDSTTALFWAIQQFGKDNIHVINFKYGQRHEVECKAATYILDLYGIAEEGFKRKFIDVDIPVSSALLSERNINAEGRGGLPASFVPGRNIIFASYAAAMAYDIEAHYIITGVNEIDYSGYPDCRSQVFEHLSQALTKGLEWDIYFRNPLIKLDKKGIILLAYSLGDDAWEALAYTVTCYNGEIPGCGECNSCKIRARGFDDAGLEDPARKVNAEWLRRKLLKIT